MRFLTPKGRCFADIQPMTDEFGWSRRNAFIQPQVDAVMYEGLQRFPHVRCLFSREVEAFSQSCDAVTLHLKGTAANTKRCRPTGWSPATAAPALFAAAERSLLKEKPRRISGSSSISPTIRWRRRTSICAATRCARTFPPRCRTAYAALNLW
jgi:hypothetical protein